MTKSKFKDPLTITRQVSSERRALDYWTRGNFFATVKPFNANIDSIVNFVLIVKKLWIQWPYYNPYFSCKGHGAFTGTKACLFNKVQGHCF